MHSEPRRPDHINLDRFVEKLDERLRGEVGRVRRAILPRRINRLIRAAKVRALAIVQGGTLALTAIAVIVAVGIAPSIDSGTVTEDSSILGAPKVKTESVVLMRAGDYQFAPNSATILAVAERGFTR
jgi:hypothetical protein